MPSFQPTPGNIKKLHIGLGVINTDAQFSVGGPNNILSVNVSGGSHGFSFLASDLGNIVEIQGVGAGGTSIFTTIVGVAGVPSIVTVHDPPVLFPATTTVIMYRQLPATGDDHVKIDSINGPQSIRNAPTFNFSVISLKGLFEPLLGQPILVTHDDYGDYFGGRIEQVTTENWALNTDGSTALMTTCECVSFDRRLAQRNLFLASQTNNTTTQPFTLDGSSRSYTLLAPPTVVTDVSLIGLCSISTGGILQIIHGAQFYQGIGSKVTIGGIDYPVLLYFSTDVAILGGSPPNSSGVAYSIKQTFAIKGTDTTSQWFWDPTSNSIDQGFEKDNFPSETLIPFGGTFNGIQVTYSYSTQLTFSGETPTSLITKLFALIPEEGFTLSITVDPGIPAIDNITFTKKDTFDSALQQIVKNINDGTNNYWYRISPRKVFTFNIIGVTAACPFAISTLDGSDGNVKYHLSLQETLEKFVNSSVVEQSSAQGSKTIQQNIIGGAPQRRSWQVTAAIAATPTIIRRTLGTNGITGAQAYVDYPQTVGLLNDPATGTGHQWYWSPNSSTITQDPVGGFALGFGPGGIAVAEQLQVIYLPVVSLLQTYKDTASITARKAIEGGSGQYDTYVSPPSVAALTGSSNANYAQSVVAAYNQLSNELTVDTYLGGAQAGMSIVVHLPEIGVVGTWVINSVELSEEGAVCKWKLVLVLGSVIGDWLTGWRSIAGGETGISNIGSGNASGQPGTTSAGTTDPVNFNVLSLTASWISSTQYEVDLLLDTGTDVSGIIGCHVYAEIPEVSLDGSPVTVGSSDIGGAQLAGPWSPVDLYKLPFVSNVAPVKVVLTSAELYPDGVPVSDLFVRIYLRSFALGKDPAIVQAGRPGETTSVVITIPQYTIPNNRGTGGPKGGSSSTVVTTWQVASIDATGSTITAALDAVSVGGVMHTPIAVTVTLPAQIPINTAYQIQAFVDGDLTNSPVAVSPVSIANGLVPNDGSIPLISATTAANTQRRPTNVPPYTLGPITPGTVQVWRLYAVSGIMKTDVHARVDGVSVGAGTITHIFSPNMIVPGVTPSVDIEVGQDGGTLDPRQLIMANTNNTMAVTEDGFGVDDNGITHVQIATAAVESDSLAAGSVINVALGAGSVFGTNIANATVALANMSTLSVDTAQLVAASIDSTKIQALAVTAAALANSSVTAVAIANLAVGSAAIANLAVGTAAIAAAAITTTKITNGSIVTALIANAAITSALIANLAVTNAHIVSLDASKLTAATISASVTLTAPTLIITAGSTTINIDATNQFKVSKSGYVQQIGTGFSTSFGFVDGLTLSGASGTQICVVQAGGFSVGGPSGTSGAYSRVIPTQITTFNASGNGVIIDATSGLEIQVGASFMTLGFSGFSSIGGSSGYNGSLASAIAAGKTIVGGIIVS